jgi:hypothetical protein
VWTTAIACISGDDTPDIKTSSSRCFSRRIRTSSYWASAAALASSCSLWTRYRLAVGFAGLTVGFGIIRYISLHEVDAWNANAPKARTAIDLVAAAGVSAVAIARLCQLQPGF